MSKRKKPGYRPVTKRSSSNYDVKKIMIYTIALLLVIAIYVYLANLRESEEQIRQPEREEPAFRKDGELNFLDNAGSMITSIDIEIADNNPSRRQGLMFRQSMDENQGMLFIFDISHTIEMWMRNTYIPLDMIFVDEDLTVINIETHTTPFSEEGIFSSEPARYVIEVNAGFTERHGIRPGHSIEWH